MRKLTFLMGCLAIMIAGAMIISCEGPVGPAGTDGQDGQDGADGDDGIDGNVTCLVCHSDGNQATIVSEFAASQHSSGAIAVDYAGGRSACAECHSHEGFVEFARTGDIANNYANPSAWQCGTCHNVHTDFEATDYALRDNDDVVLYADGTITLSEGNNNTCINCHQSRRTVGAYDDETTDTTYTRKFTDPDDIAAYGDINEVAVGPAGSVTLDQTGVIDTLVVVFDIPVATHAYISSTHAGPHHGPQANLWAGVAAGVVDGAPYGPHDGGCVECHMGPESGHTFTPEAATCLGCHTDKKTEMKTIAGRLEAIALALEALHAVHIDDTWETGDALFGSVHPVYASLERDDFNAWWNFTLIMEDRSMSAHNPTYVKALLTSIETTLGIVL